MLPQSPETYNRKQFWRENLQGLYNETDRRIKDIVSRF